MGAKPNATGATRMKELGYKPVTLWFTAEELAAIDAAANREKKKRAKWAATALYHAAQKSEQDARRNRTDEFAD